MKRIIPAYKNLLDVLQDAILKERDAEQFYLEAAEIAVEPDVRDFLLEMADMEAQHHNLLRSRLDALKADERVMTGIMSSFGDEEGNEKSV